MWFHFPHYPISQCCYWLSLPAPFHCQISGKVAMTHFSDYTILFLSFFIFILGFLTIIISFSNGTLMLYPQSKESGHMSTTDAMQTMVSFSHSIHTVYVCCLCLDFIAALTVSLCCRIWKQSVMSNLKILKLCKLFSVPFKERQQGDISNYYMITVLHNGHTVIMRAECIWFDSLGWPPSFSKMIQNFMYMFQQVASTSGIEGGLCFMLLTEIKQMICHVIFPVLLLISMVLILGSINDC